MAARNLSKFLDQNCDVSPAPDVKFVFRDEQGLVKRKPMHTAHALWYDRKCIVPAQ
jgi:hypothetical protein